jgi:hypothetical protein
VARSASVVDGGNLIVIVTGIGAAAEGIHLRGGGGVVAGLGEDRDGCGDRRG